MWADVCSAWFSHMEVGSHGGRSYEGGALRDTVYTVLPKSRSHVPLPAHSTHLIPTVYSVTQSHGIQRRSQNGECFYYGWEDGEF